MSRLTSSTSIRLSTAGKDYNVLFAEKDGTRPSSQIMAFEDTWEWNVDAERAYEEIVERGGRVSEVLRAFRTFLGNSDMMAYLADWYFGRETVAIESLAK
jgi:hypothetical protein